MRTYVKLETDQGNIWVYEDSISKVALVKDPVVADKSTVTVVTDDGISAEIDGESVREKPWFTTRFPEVAAEIPVPKPPEPTP